MGQNQSKWLPSPFNSIKLDVEAAWARVKASMAVLAQNLDGKVQGLYHNNYECIFTVVVELLDIQKVYMVSNNFHGHQIQVRNRKNAVKVLLGIIDCSWQVVTVYE